MLRYLVLGMAGAVVGGLLGYFQPEIHELGEVTSDQRLALSAQMALAFTLVFVAVGRYLAWRRQLLEKISGTDSQG